MRIGIQAWGTEGDLRPFLALGGGLARAGHQVTLVLSDLAGRRYDAYAAPLGVEIRMVAEPPPERGAHLDRLTPRLLAASPARQAELVVDELFRPAVPEMLEAARTLVRESDLVIGHYFHHPVRAVAEAASVPEVSVTLAGDVIPSASYAPTGLPSLFGAWNRAWWRVAEWSMRRTFLPPVNDLRATLSLPPLSSMSEAWHSRLLDLVAVSPTLVHRPPDWPEHHRISGFFRLPEEGTVERVSPELEEFLASGEAPVHVGFGSLGPRGPEERARLGAVVEEALERAGVRGIVQGMASPGTGTPRPDIVHVDRLPHAAVFPRCSAVVHHGGAGTTQTAVRAGVPSVVVPHVADQLWWGRILQERGVAPPPLSRRTLSAGALADRIRAARLPSMVEAARELGRGLREGPDGVERAVRLVEDVLS